jgi:hypothetical protein
MSEKEKEARNTSVNFSIFGLVCLQFSFSLSLKILTIQKFILAYKEELGRML